MARRFRFRLETLLKVRELREREVKRKVASKRAEIARLDRTNERAADEILLQQRKLLESQQRGRLDPETVRSARAWITVLRSSIVHRQAQKARWAEELEQLQAEYRQARKQTRMIQKLRERRYREHVKRLDKRDLADADELAQQLHVFAHEADQPAARVDSRASARAALGLTLAARPE